MNPVTQNALDTSLYDSVLIEDLRTCPHCFKEGHVKHFCHSSSVMPSQDSYPSGPLLLSTATTNSVGFPSSLGT